MAVETENEPKLAASERRRQRLKKILTGDVVDRVMGMPDPPPAEPVVPTKEAAPVEFDKTTGMSLGDLAAHTAAALKEPPVEKPAETPPAEPPKETPPAAVAPPTEPPKVEPPKEEPTKVVRRAKELVATPPVVEPPKPPPVAEPAVKTLAERAGFPLTEEEHEYLDIAAYAESKDPTKKGLVDREIARIRTVRDRVAAWEKAHEGQPFNPQADESAAELMKKFEPPALTARQMRQLDHQRIKDEVEADVRAKVSTETTGKLSEVEAKLRRIEVEPQIEKQATEFEGRFIDELPDDIRKVVKEKGVAGYKSADKIEGRLVEQSVTFARDVAQSIGRLANGLETFSEGNVAHRYAMESLTLGENYMKTNPKAPTIRDGRRFVTSAEWLEMAKSNPGGLQNVWTFDQSAWLEITRGRLTAELAGGITAHRKDMEESGYVKKPASPPPSPPVSPPKNGDEPPKKDAPKVAPKPSGGQPKTQIGFSVVDRYLKGVRPGA